MRNTLTYLKHRNQRKQVGLYLDLKHLMVGADRTCRERQLHNLGPATKKHGHLYASILLIIMLRKSAKHLFNEPRCSPSALELLSASSDIYIYSSSSVCFNAHTVDIIM